MTASQLENWLLRLGNLELMSVVLALVLFVAFYGIKSNWSANSVGRALFWMALSMLIVCIQATLTILFGDWPGRSVLRAVTFGFVAFTVWRMFWELRRVQKFGKAPDRKEAPGRKDPERNPDLTEQDEENGYPKR